jgi:hypothetical protein
MISHQDPRSQIVQTKLNRAKLEGRDDSGGDALISQPQGTKGRAI